MSNLATMSRPRHKRAARALKPLGPQRSEHEVLLVKCRQGHTVATVYATDIGPVYLAHIGPHSHGDMDFPYTGLRVERPGQDYVDLLYDTWADDYLPAWCHCVNRILSRTNLQAAIAAGRRSMLVR